ncbi:LytR/AlgR family response regulator transcription factor [Marinoscillum furvescens]|uniref:DNA-binding LytR/AlgR family response regulator n=1 Tax=Marinoscillum furvescens DSM 4134 TaxID=1122208 RepID=A0A3D9KYE7_MARFU|nr:LytTR family DNA-binding domain-containing protein [Marinoscillum furvescens]RED92201.1 DNA-binding LytR/AlgR family response regulator [Marinoscillum furvescens DSM 4134]
MQRPPLKCMIIDPDETASQQLIRAIAECPELQLVATHAHFSEASHIDLAAIDVIFLDIDELGVHSAGFFASVPDACQVVITSRTGRFSSEAFAFNVTDYLVKPLTKQRFDITISKLTALAVSAPQQSDSSLLVKSDGSYHKLAYHDILYVEGLQEYVTFHTTTKKLIVLHSLKKLEQLLPAEFIRTHKSFIVNCQNISSFSSTSIVIGNRSLPVGSNYRKNTYQRLTHHYAPLVG